ncbi:hypothetical protein H312_03136 [Anncaliia algerae PRA339]|uniref:Uncharacterized protein n=1 Tax=Anncaliia algerae PRA339 TaxID=1288291 RepID=A0A059EX86_9MICR|nr:hypothetical protein H312_03136 [Anncaliia algerae PRA339]
MLKFVYCFLTCIFSTVLEDEEKSHYYLPSNLFDDDNKKIFSLTSNQNCHKKLELKESDLSVQEETRIVEKFSLAKDDDDMPPLQKSEHVKNIGTLDSSCIKDSFHQRKETRQSNCTKTNLFFMVPKESKYITDKPLMNEFDLLRPCRASVKGFSLCENLSTELFFWEYPIDIDDNYAFCKILSCEIFKKDIFECCKKRLSHIKEIEHVDVRKIRNSIDYIFCLNFINVKEFIYFLTTIIHQTRIFQQETINFHDFTIMKCSQREGKHSDYFDFSIFDRTKEYLENSIFRKDPRFSFEDFLNFFFKNEKDFGSLNSKPIIAFGYIFRNLYLHYYCSFNIISTTLCTSVFN